MGVDIPVNEKGRRIGQYHPRSTIPDKMVECMRDMHERKRLSYGQIALRLHLSVNSIKKICRYERRAEIVAGWRRVKC